MLKINGTDYGLCLLDTNAVSEMLKNRDRALRNYLTWSLGDDRPTFVSAFSLFTILELRQSPAVYEQFTDVFSTVPCLLLKGRDQLLEDEIRLYPDPSSLDPSLLGFAGPLSTEGGSLAEILQAFFATEEGQDQERRWNDGRREIVEGIGSLVANFQPADRSYTAREVRTFLEIAGYQQIAMMDRNFARAMNDRGEAVMIDAFPSIKASTLTVFFKFYADRDRRPHLSDAYDIVIASATPYVDAIVTESHQAEAIRKMRRLDDFVSGLEVLTLRDVRDAAERP